MKKIDAAIVRVFQFLLLMFFTFTVFLYYGSILMIALSLWVNLTAMLGHVFGAFLSAILALALLLGVCYYIAKIPRLVETYLAVGMDLIKLAYSSITRFGELLGKSKTDPPAAAGKPAEHKA
ncbi:MAG: hypothetical protein ACE5ET_07085 [Gammaproteobacteria bacterium]